MSLRYALSLFYLYLYLYLHLYLHLFEVQEDVQEEEPDDVMPTRKTCWAELGAHFHDCWRWRRRVIRELLNIVLYIVRIIYVYRFVQLYIIVYYSI